MIAVEEGEEECDTHQRRSEECDTHQRRSEECDTHQRRSQLQEKKNNISRNPQDERSRALALEPNP
jgi:hypothetical protein